MITTSQRPLTDSERQVLRRLASKRGRLVNDIAGIGCVTMLVLLPAMWAIRWLRLSKDPWEAVAFCLALAMGFATGLYMRRKTRAFTPRPGVYTEDLENGVATEITYEVLDAIQVDELEDEGSNYYLKLADGRVLFLSGQYLYEPEETKSFPSTRVRRALASRSGLLLDFQCLGAYFPPSSTRPAFTLQQHRAHGVPEDGAILDVEFEALRAGAA